MKPKQQIDPNAAGAEVLRLLKEDCTEDAKLKDMRTTKVARKEALKVALTAVWAAFDRGESVNGYSTRKEWCKEFAKVTIKTVQRIIFGRKRDEPKDEATKWSPDIAVSLADVQFNENEASVLIEIEQEHKLKYQGKRRNGDISIREDNGGTEASYKVLEKEGKVVWTHTVREIFGNVCVRVENEDGSMTEKQLIASLGIKMTGALKSMRLWDKKLTEQFNDAVKETTDWYEEQAESRSRSAKKAAESRKKKSPHVKEVGNNENSPEDQVLLTTLSKRSHRSLGDCEAPQE